MIANLARIIFVLATLVLGGSLEELMPKFLSVGFPVLFAATLLFAIRRSLVTAVVFTVLAGWMEDALAGLPFLTSLSFFLAAAALARWTRLTELIMLIGYPAYELWLWIWFPSLSGGLYARILVSIPLGILTSLVTGAVLSAAERRAALND